MHQVCFILATTDIYPCKKWRGDQYLSSSSSLRDAFPINFIFMFKNNPLYLSITYKTAHTKPVYFEQVFCLFPPLSPSFKHPLSTLAPLIICAHDQDHLWLTPLHHMNSFSVIIVSLAAPHFHFLHIWIITLSELDNQIPFPSSSKCSSSWSGILASIKEETIRPICIWCFISGSSFKQKWCFLPLSWTAVKIKASRKGDDSNSWQRGTFNRWQLSLICEFPSFSPPNPCV